MKIPEGWEWKMLNEIGKIVTGSTPSKTNSKFFGSTYPFYKPSDLDAGSEIFESNDGLTDEGMTHARLLPKDSILVTCIGATIGKASVIKKAGASNQQINAIISNHSVALPKYVYYWIISKPCQNAIIKNSSSSALPIINKSKFEKLMIPIPPLQDQQKIIQKLDHVLEQLKEKKKIILELQNKNLDKLLHDIKSFILTKAFTGDLTIYWRNNHKNIIPASELILRLKKQKNNLVIEKNELKQDHVLSKLPAYWKWTNIETLTDIISGKSFKESEYAKDGVRLLQIANVSFGKIIWATEKFLPHHYLKSYPDLMIKKGDMIIALNRPILGNKLKIGIMDDDVPTILYQRVGKFRLYEDDLTKYVFYYLQSPFFIRILQTKFRGSDQPFINKSDFLSLPIPLAPEEEQKEIIKNIEERLSQSNELEIRIKFITEMKKHSLLQINYISNAILDRAFSGKLIN